MSKSRDYADLKQDLDNAAFTGQYTDLDGLPTIPTTLSELTNDSGYLTSVSLGLDDLTDVTTSAAGDNKFLTKTGSTYLFTGLEYSDLAGTPDAISAGTGVSLASGEIAIGQAVGTTDAPTFTDMTLDGTGSIKVPSGTTAQRDGTPVNGMFRYNAEDDQFEGYANGAWGAIAGGGEGSLSTSTFTGDGTTTAFTLSITVASENDLIVFINGVFQAQDTYSVSGTTLTFATAPFNTRTITAYQVGPISADPIVITAGTGITVSGSEVSIPQTIATSSSPTFVNTTLTGALDTTNLKISGGQGTDGQVLTSTGSGVAWEDAASGGGGGGGGGIVLQTVYKSGQAFSRSNSTSWTGSSLYLDITPESSSSMMIIQFHTLIEAQGDGAAQGNFTIYANGTRIDNSYYKRAESTMSYEHAAITQTHTHGTTSQIQYKLYMQADPAGGSYAWAYASPNRDYYDILITEVST